ncbi:MAG TPA: fimbrillin family protein [Porphyromonadaceae bacterium]|nr:fimbrillin family protein [Porphyromonadaceae bacterium]
MKQKFLSMLLLSAAITGCTSHDVVDTEYNNQANGIRFSAYNGITRGNPVDGNGEFMANGSTFGVTAFISTGTGAFMGTTGEGAAIVSNGTTWGYVNAGDMRYWPTGGQALDFYAYAPYGHTSITNKSFTKTTGLSFDYTVPTDEAKQVDVMFASATGQTKAAGTNAVNLSFKHALTQVHFAVATKTSSLKIDIAPNGITINNIKSTGTFTLPTAANANGWELTDDKTSYTVTSDEITGEYKDDETPGYTEIGSADNALMLLPQTFGALSGENEGASLTISCKIYQVLSDGTKIYLKGSETGFASIDVPVSSMGVADGVATEVWNRGKKVTYRLLIGGGPATGLEPIEFTTGVDSWDTADGGVIENQ